jgi:hypothetical protein
LSGGGRRLVGMTGLSSPSAPTELSAAASSMLSCPAWCRRHTRARCLSEAAEVVYRHGALDLAFAVQLEQWAGGRTFGRREVTANLLLPDLALRLPEEPAVALGRAWWGLLDGAGWVK